GAGGEVRGGRGGESARVGATATMAAEALGYRPLEAGALTLFGTLLIAAGDAARAEPAYQRAVLAADAGRHDAIRVEAEIGLLEAVVRQHRFDRAERLAEAARAALERDGDDVKNKAYLALGLPRIYETPASPPPPP